MISTVVSLGAPRPHTELASWTGTNSLTVGMSVLRDRDRAEARHLANRRASVGGVEPLSSFLPGVGKTPRW
jgi:hypothetical protein